MKNNKAFGIWTICKNPSDYPGLYTARLTLITPEGIIITPEQGLFISDTLEGIRSKIPPLVDFGNFMAQERQIILELIKALEICVNALKFISSDVKCYSLDVATVIAREALLKLPEYTSMQVQ